MTAQHGDVATGPGWELRCGRWQDVLADVTECDALITDPPYSERTHAGALDATTLERGVSYCHLTDDDARAIVTHWSDRVGGWIVVHTDDVLHPVFRAAYIDLGRYAFPMLPVLQQQPRVTGDGPPSAGHLLAVSRPRERRFLSWGSLPGWYVTSRDGSIVRGGKPLDLMRAIVRDYTRPGDLVVDLYAGGGTTLLAAVMEGRRAIGAEMDPATFDKAVARLRKGFTAPLFHDEPQRMEQTGLVFPVEPEPEQDQEPDADAYEPETYDERCQWCGDANCEGGCPDNPRNLEACS